MRTGVMVVLVVVAVALWVAFVRPGLEQRPVGPPTLGHSGQGDEGAGDALIGNAPVGPLTPPPPPNEDPQQSVSASRLDPEDLPARWDDVVAEMEGYLQEGWVLVVGSVVMPEGMTAVGLSMDFDSEDAYWSPGKVILQEDGMFVVGLEPSTAWAVAISPSCGRTIFEAAFAVPPGKTVRPRALQSIDLTSSVEVVELRVLAPDLSPARSAWASEWWCCFGDWRDRGLVEGGVLRRMVCRREHPVRLSGHGFRPQELTLVPGVNEAVMEPGIAARLTLKDYSLPEAGWVLGATPSNDGRLLPGRYLEFDSHGVIETSFSEPGRYTLEWTVREEGGRHHRLGHVEGATKHLDVADQSGTQEFVVSVPAAFVRARVQELRDD